MDDIQLKLGDNGRGAFLIEKGNDRLAEMGIGIANGNLTVYHTEVSEKLQGQGIGSKLLAAMVAYARKHQLKIIALCPYVLAQFKRHPEQYADVWNQNWHSKA
jgi:predicted GNAT family acetyltransferase